MQTDNVTVTYGDNVYAGWDFYALPLGAALIAAAQQIDQQADQARLKILADPLRALEYQIAATEAKTFATESYTGDVPPSVQAWMDAADLDAKSATDSILIEANAWQGALYAIRAARLNGKQHVLKASTHEAAQAIADAAISAINQSIAGVGNAA